MRILVRVLYLTAGLSPDLFEKLRNQPLTPELSTFKQVLAEDPINELYPEIGVGGLGSMHQGFSSEPYAKSEFSRL
jgi:hypothetical protein